MKLAAQPAAMMWRSLGWVRQAGGWDHTGYHRGLGHSPGRAGGSSLVGSKGGLRLEPFGFFQSQGDLNLDTTVDLQAFAWRTNVLRAETDLGASPQAHWAAVLQGRVALLPTAELALNTMLISEAIYLSERLGREVTAEEVKQASVSTAVTL